MASSLYKTSSVLLAFGTTSALARTAGSTAPAIPATESRVSVVQKVQTITAMGLYVINSVLAGGTIEIDIQGCPVVDGNGDDTAAFPMAKLVNGDVVAALGANTGIWYSLGNVNLCPFVQIKITASVNTCTPKVYLTGQ